MTPKSRANREETVLVLQGGGALGAYQAGAYEALAEHGIEPQWVAGISIGAINGAIIAGNRPEHRVERLRTFWRRVSSGLQGIPLTGDGRHRTLFNEASALVSLVYGVPGFFEPRVPPPVFTTSPGTAALGYYTTAPLVSTLMELVDFDYLNREGPRLSVGAVNIRSGNFAYFDCAKIRLAPEHDEPQVTIVQLIYRERAYETHQRDYEFSRVSVEEHWEQGRKDVLETLRHDSWRNRKKPKDGVTTLDLTRNGKGREHAGRRS